MVATPESRWVKFLRNYGPIPTNDNMYDETIQRSIRKLKIEPLVLPAQFVDVVLDNFRSDNPQTEILTGTAGDGKTYNCREVWTALGGSPTDWNRGEHVQRLELGARELVIIKDLSELKSDERSAEILERMAADVGDPNPKRIYLVAANHGQLLEKLKSAPQTAPLAAMTKTVESLLVNGVNPDPAVRLNLRDLSQAPASAMIALIIEKMTSHAGWSECSVCPLQAAGTACPIVENRKRLEAPSGEVFRKRLTALVELSEQNGVHFPVRQSLALVTNILLGHPDAADGLMSCGQVADLASQEKLHLASIYRNVFGENLTSRRAEKTDLFRKLNSFGIGSETSNKVDDLLVYGADDPDLRDTFEALVLSDPTYGGTPAYLHAQRDYLEGSEYGARDAFLPMLRSQRQRLFFTLPENYEAQFELWDLTVFRYGGTYLDLIRRLKAKEPVPRGVMPLIMRGLNRVFTGMLVQNQDELVLATSGSHSQSKTSPLLDEMISVPRQQGEEVTLTSGTRGEAALRVRVARGDDPGPIVLGLTPMRFEFLGRVAEGALPSSFSLECHEDLLMFKAKLLSATERRRELDEDDSPVDGELMLRFIEVGTDGRAAQRRVVVRI